MRLAASAGAASGSASAAASVSASAPLPSAQEKRKGIKRAAERDPEGADAVKKPETGGEEN